METGHDTTAGQSGTPLAWEGPAVGLLDLDAFFASVEMLDHPEWRGRPVIVGGAAERRGVVATASYEARRYGVHSAMPSAQARRLCPDAIWTQGHFDRYREVSAQVMGVIASETPYVEQVSIDEAFFDVTPGRYSHESPIDICRRMQERVSRIGVTCSIGLGVNKTVAKIASDRDKPRGMTVVLPGTEASFLAPLPVRDMSGIGKATERRLAQMGIHTLGQLARQDPTRMREAFGVAGPRMVTRAGGRERSHVLAQDVHERPKSVSNERTFERDLTTRDEIEAAILHVCAMTGARLRRKGLAGYQVTLKIKPDATHTKTAQRQLGERTDDEHEFGPAATELLDTVWHEGMPVRLVGVEISGFEPREHQLQLFPSEGQASDDEARRERLHRLSEATDLVRERFGKDVLSYGRDLRFRGHTTGTAPMNKEDF